MSMPCGCSLHAQHSSPPRAFKQLACTGGTGYIHAMLHWIHNIGFLFYKAGDNLVEDDGIEMAGYLTFLSILALFPFLVLLVAAAGFIGQGELGSEFIEFIIRHLPQDAVASLRPRVEEIISGPPSGLLTVSILGAIWTSSSAVEGLRSVLNRAYDVSDPPSYLFRRLMSMLQILLFTAILIVLMLGLVLAPVVITNLSTTMGIAIPSEILTFFADDFVYLSAGLIFIGVASLYYWLPNISQSLLAVVPGALLVVVLWIAGAAGVTFYLTTIDQVNIIYGSLSSFIATLIFFFVMNLIFIYGAEFNHQLLVMLGKRIIEREHAPTTKPKPKYGKAAKARKA